MELEQLALSARQTAKKNAYLATPDFTFPEIYASKMFAHVQTVLEQLE